LAVDARRRKDHKSKLTSEIFFVGESKMKKALVASLIVAMMAGMAFANPEGICPDGKLIGHLKIIGVAKDKNANMDGAAGNVIFVGLGSTGQADRTKIYLFEGDDCAVLDKNGTDGEAAFQLPDPNLDPYLIGDPGDADTISAYSVFIRPLGKPGGWATITTCADLLDSTFADLLPGTLVRVLNRKEGLNTYCSIEQVGSEITLRKTGKSVFANVTAELLTIVFQVEVQTGVDPITGAPILEVVCVRVPIFDDILQNEYWEYDDYGLKNLDVRFYDCPTDVSAGDGDLVGC
jgi:hypothetical protein